MLTTRFYELVVVSLVIQVGFLLPLSVYFYRASWAGVSANLFLVPLLGLVVPLGLATLLLALASETLAGLLAIPLAALVEMMQAAARWHAGLFLGSVRVPPPPAWVSAMFLLATASLAGGLLARRARLAGAGALALAAAAVLITWHPFRPQLPQRELEITALDVAQGDALVVLSQRLQPLPVTATSQRTYARLGPPGPAFQSPSIPYIPLGAFFTGRQKSVQSP